MDFKKLKLPIIIISIGLAAAVVSCFLVGILKEPLIKTHDFEYSVTYRLDGEVETYEGVFKCSFDGYDGSDDPTLRCYDGEYIHNGDGSDGSSFAIAQKNGIELFVITELDANYLMGDPDKYEYESGNEDPYFEAIDAEGYGVEVYDTFDVEIISWDYPEPIENSFKFAGFSVLYVGSMLAMLAVGILTIIACVIFVKKNEGVSYNLLDKISVAVTFIIGFVVVPFISVVIFFLPLTMDSRSLVYQIYLCVPALTVFSIAASVALRRKGFRISGLLVQLAFPVLLFAQMLVESFIYNVFS